MLFMKVKSVFLLLWFLWLVMAYLILFDGLSHSLKSMVQIIIFRAWHSLVQFVIIIYHDCFRTIMMLELLLLNLSCEWICVTLHALLIYYYWYYALFVLFVVFSVFSLLLGSVCLFIYLVILILDFLCFN